MPLICCYPLSLIAPAAILANCVVSSSPVITKFMHQRAAPGLIRQTFLRSFVP